MITIFETGLIDYSDLGLVKPVLFTEDDLRMIASSTECVDLTDEHTDKVLSSLSNFIVGDGRLQTKEPENVDFKGKGFSPVINCDELIDVGEHYRMNGIHMSSIGLTSNPRNKILYNSIKNPNGGNGMSNGNDDEFRKLVADNRTLTEEVGSLKHQLSNLSKKLDAKENELKEAKNSNNEVDDKLAQFEEFEKKAKAYDDLLEKERESLITEVINGDESKRERYESFTNSQLQVMIEDKKNNNRQGRGVNSNGVQTQSGNEPNPTPDPNEDYYDWDTFESECEALGL